MIIRTCGGCGSPITENEFGNWIVRRTKTKFSMGQFTSGVLAITCEHWPLYADREIHNAAREIVQFLGLGTGDVDEP